MQLIDIIIIVVYFLLSLLISLFLAKRAGKSAEDFFLSGRQLPWWVAGTTMVATTFSADTPLAVTEMVAKDGIAGNWLWWNMVAANVLAVFFFAKLWRRANIITDIEFIEIRYSGKSAAFLRGFKAVYFGIFMNVIIMGWVNIALAEILKTIFGINDMQVFYYILGSMIIVGLYSAISGLWGVAFTDIFQFIVAMAGCIILAVIILNLPEIGGIDGLKSRLPEHTFNFLPSISFNGLETAKGMTISFSAFIAFISIQWWASWYPGSEAGGSGGGYVAQRMMSSKDERHSLLATLWFTIAHYAIRPWPWILVALSTLVLYPGLKEPKAGYVLAMKDHLPAGLLGVLVAAFLAAYMSTISTHLNWGSSYLVNDLYKRFIKKDGDEKHYVFISRIVTFVLMIVSSLLVLLMGSIIDAWKFILECGAGLGLVLILRWFWWRINAWSEITAMIAPFIGYGICRFVIKIEFPESLFLIVPFTAVVWLIATFTTKPVDGEVLKSFYIRTRPGGPGWEKIRSEIKDMNIKPESLTALFINWIIGIILVYSSLFSIGKLILKEYYIGLILLSIAALSFVVIYWRLRE